MIETQTKFIDGIHVYVSINNYEALVSQDENKSNSIKHILHMIHFIYVGIEDFISNIKSSKDETPIYIEKVTGSRLHLFIKKSPNMIDIFERLCGFCHELFNKVNESSKYKTLQNATLNIGAEYGNTLFYNFNEDGFNEPTSIGLVANIAAKIQSNVKNNYVGLGPILYKELISKKNYYCKSIEFDDALRNKYNCSFAKLPLSLILDNVNDSKMQKLIELLLSKIKDFNLDNIKFVYPKNKQDLQIRDLNSVADFNAIVISADIRGSTDYLKQEQNSDESITRVINALNTMYYCCKNNGGVHVQFQGDKELSYFMTEDIKKAIKYALDLSSAIKETGFHVGIGISFGEIYTTTFGKNRNSISNKKEVGIIGRTVRKANTLEDEYADKDEIYISGAVYNLLNDDLKGIFHKDGSYYATNNDMKSFRTKINLNNNFNTRTDVNKAWKK